MMKQYLAALTFSIFGWAQADTYTIMWNEPKINICTTGESIKTLSFEGESQISSTFKVGQLRLVFDGKIQNINFSNLSYIKCSTEEDSILDKSLFSNTVSYDIKSTTSRSEIHSFVNITPIIKGKDGKLYKIKSFDLSIQKNNLRTQQTATISSIKSSVLSKGDWYKVAVSKNGIFKLDYAYLKNIGIAVDAINPNTVQLFGFGGMLAEENSEFRYEDLPEVPTKFVGNGDSKLDANEFFLVYLQGPDKLSLGNNYTFTKNIYSDKAYYFITHSQTNRKNVENAPQLSTFDAEYNTYDFFYRHEVDVANFMPSGRLWVGESLVKSPNLSFNISIPELAENTTVTVKGNVAGSNRQTTSCIINYNGQSSNNYSLAVKPAGGSNYTEVTFFDFWNTMPSSSVNGNYSLSFQYTKGGSENLTYLDYFQIEAIAKLKFTDNYLLFSNKASQLDSYSKFNLSTSKGNIEVWNVNKIDQITNMPLSNASGTLSFIDSATVTGNYVAVDLNATFENPSFVEKTSNQNLHAESTPDLLIITHSSLRNAADRLANFRRSHDGYNVLVVNVDKIYNEFSSGAQDLSALRDYVKFLYNNDKSKLKWVMLFGACSYDYKDRIANNTNFVPVFETINSENTVNSYSSDDYIGLLDPDEGGDIFGGMDVGIGRIPARNADEAEALVDKLIYYSTSHLSYDKWKNNLSFVCDDGDSNTHMDASEELITEVLKYTGSVKVNKLYLSLFPEVSSPIGQTCPTLVQKIVDEVEKGTFMMNYSGHGREIGWAGENILTLDMIRNFKNKEKLFLLTAGTCEFGRYDAPEIISGVLESIYNQNGGAIATIAASRPVYASGNKALNKYLMRFMFEKANGTYLTLGEILRKSKGYFPNDANSKSYALLGDPSLVLKYPNYNITIDEILDENNNAKDTMKALSKVTLKGSVKNNNVLVSDFKGELTLTLFDKEFNKLSKYDPESDGSANPLSIEKNIKLRESIIYQGKAIVSDGKFSVSFIVPKDISYLIGNGLVLTYAKNDSSNLDASGGFVNFFIGDSDDNVPTDNNPPKISLYINDTTFKDGGLTGNNITLLAKITDESGINLSRTSVGHEISLVIDGESQNSITINDYYIAEQNSFTNGSINYPLFDLSEGDHTLTVRVWDIFNNSSTATIHFVVKTREGLSIGELSSIPAPNEDFLNFQFSHNRAGETLDAELQIFDMQGNRVRDLKAIIPNANSVVSEVYWQTGTGDAPNKTTSSSSLYVYKLFLKSEYDGSADKKIQKLVFQKY